ncbi:MAG: hypothetical protein VXY56_07835, partial [Pseudomonadota bacterium]|nr:hypothetical protein [Pseudomonadota bacterium]
AILNESAAEQMGAAFGLGTRGARSLADDAAAVRSADTLEKQLAAVERLRENFVALVGPVGQMTEDQLEYYIAIADTQRGLEQVTSRIVEAQKDQTVNLRAQYGLFRTMIEDARRLAATDALGDQYRIYGLIRSEAEAAARSAADEVEALRQKAEVGAATARTGADSLATARARVAAEREAYAETVNVRDVSDDMKRALMEAWDAANGLVAASRNADFADARANAAAMANEVERALAALNGMAAASRANLQDERLRSQFADDPVGLAGALAGAAFDRQTAGATTDPLLADAIAAQRAELVAEAEDAARERKAREDAAESARKGEAAATRAAREAERAADEQARALDRQRDAYDGLISRLDPATGASLRFAEATETINAALAQGHITAAE